METKEEQIKKLSKENYELKKQISVLKETIANKVLEMEKLKEEYSNKTPGELFEQMNRMVLEWQFWEDDSKNHKREIEAKEKQLQEEIKKRKEIEEKYKAECIIVSNENKRLLREVETLNMEVDYLHNELEKRTMERDVALYDLKNYEDNGGREERFIKYFEGMDD